MALKKHPTEKEDWSYTEFINKATGELKVQLYYRTKKACQEVLNCRKSKQLAAYGLMTLDMKNIKRWAEMSNKTTGPRKGVDHSLIDKEKELETTDARAFFVAVLTFYARLFTTAKGRKIKLEKAIIPDEFMYEHEQMDKFRHNFAAHSGDKGIEIYNTYFAWFEDKKRGIFHSFLTAQHSQPVSFYFDERYFALFNFLEKHVQGKVDKLQSQLAEQMTDEKFKTQ